ncbi:protein arginine N-methyltransferase 1 [Allokutzneria albata]|uniref:Protein arginine N-methyltransferase 1 n=1 Tax=Allokutzneria albata TaxID=211114 RepID=A0A1G9UCH2_ALLAB|nr:protein arginine N-methyltransferase 1 [Allokutzneria albata]
MFAQRRLEIPGPSFDVVVDESDWDSGSPQLWPSVGMHPCYDEMLYDFMTMDEVRNLAYREALRQLAPGRTVLDIGTGRDLNWAVEALGAGARRVTAVEGMDETYRMAWEHAEREGLLDRIDLRHGWSTEISLDPRVEMCVSEVIGDIGGAEGAAAILADARRRLTTPEAMFVPHLCVTFAGAACFADIFPSGAGFFADSLDLLTQAFTVLGGPCDVLLGISGIGPEAVISDHKPVEVLEFNGNLAVEGDSTVTLTAQRDGRVDGVLLWIQLWCSPDGPPVDSLHERTNWMPAYVPLFDEPREVAAGDVLTLGFRYKPSDDGIHPDYSLSGSLRTAQGVATGEHDVPYRPVGLRGRPVYERLFPTVSEE